MLAVFVFHAEPGFLPGGFIGVDIFFVLSGFLITSILLNKVGRGEPWLADFYARRAKRLLPAVLLLLVAVVIVVSVYGPPSELGQRLSEVRATIFYVANWNLITSSEDYFAEGLSVSPLRHMWSLAVEEQFYFIWPLVLAGLVALLGRRMRLLVPVGLAIVVSALLLWWHYSPTTVSRAYFGTDSRVFQPLLGSAFAIFVTLRPVSNWGRTMHRPWWAALGPVTLLALTWLTFSLDGNESAYFRWGAVVVALLTVGLILDGEIASTSPLSRFLAWRPLVLLGMISYGFYLWHWPVIQWISAPEGADFTDRRLVNLTQLIVTLAASVASYVLVEKPVRLHALRPRLTLPAAVAGMVIVAGGAGLLLQQPVTTIQIASPSAAAPTTAPFSADAGIGADPTEPIPPPTTDAAASVPQTSAAPSSTDITIEAPPAGPSDIVEIVDPASDRSFEPCPRDPEPCVKVDGAAQDAPTVALVGDSTSQAYDPALKVLAEEHGFRYVQAAVGGCPIGHRLLATGTEELHKPSNFKCFEQIPVIYEQVVQEFGVDLILITSVNETNRHVNDGVLLEQGTPEHLADVREELERSLDVLTAQSADVVFLHVLPRGPNLDCLESSPPDSGNCVRTVDPNGPEAPINDLFDELAVSRSDVAGTVSFEERLCPAGGCPLVVAGNVVRYDGIHFTGTQSRELAPVLDAALSDLGIDLDSLSDRQ